MLKSCERVGRVVSLPDVVMTTWEQLNAKRKHEQAFLRIWVAAGFKKAYQSNQSTYMYVA